MIFSQLQDKEGTGEERKSPEKVETEDIPEAGCPGGPPQQIEVKGFISGTHEILVLGGWMAGDDEEKDEQVHDVVPHE